jgi:hypothetical protein
MTEENYIMRSVTIHVSADKIMVDETGKPRSTHEKDEKCMQDFS